MNTSQTRLNLVQNFALAIRKYIDCVKNQLNSYDNYYGINHIWYREINGGFKAFYKFKYHNFLPKIVLETSTDWENLICSLEQHKDFSDFLKGDLYQDVGRVGNISIEEIFFRLLPDLIFDNSDYPVFDKNHDIESEVSTFLDIIENKIIYNITLVPILDVRAKSTIKINESIEFREFTQKEKERLLNSDIIVVGSRIHTLNNTICDWHGLVICHTIKISTFSGDMPDYNSYFDRQNNIETIIEAFITSTIFILNNVK
ncbi:hypothetical protein, partial [Elstera litoralis]|uniref:hypothetical protein n=1 Tax=Elstera litoralis TaxID=552518 RepID=UPI0012EDF069